MTLAAECDWLGIDFGTCYSSAARLVDGRPLPVKEPLRHGYSVPSSVFLGLGEPETLAVGTAAESQKQLHPERFRSEFKRELGRREPIPLGGRQMTVDRLVAAVLTFLREQCELAAGHAPAGAVITIPASYEDHLRELMRTAGRAAGFERVELLEEPVAAIVEHASHADISGKVLVYDLGGGTCDLALVEVEDGTPHVIGYDGIPDVGGVNFDQAIERDLAVRGGDALTRALEGLDSDDEDEQLKALSVRLMARDECRRIKHDLSGLPVSSTAFAVPSGFVAYELSRERLAALVAGDVRRTIDCCERLLEHHGVAWSDLEGILMVGGSCRLPFIGEMLAEASSSRPLLKVADLELAVCSGAAIHAHRLASPVSSDLVVDAAGEGDHTSIGEAVAAAAPGSTIRVRAGVYREQLELTAPIAIAGEDFRAKVVLEGEAGPLVSLSHPGARLEGLTMRATSGPAVAVGAGPVEIVDCDVAAAAGPAIEAVGGARVRVRGSRLAGPIGITLLDGAEGQLEHNLIAGATAFGVGAAGAGTMVTLRGDRVVDGAGSAVVVDDGAQATLEACDLARHALPLIYVAGAQSSVSVIGCRIADGLADGVSVDEGTLRLDDSEICGHAGIGVALSSVRSATLHSNEIRDNRLAGVGVSGPASAPELHANLIAGQRQGPGVTIHAGAAALLAGNRLTHNAGPGLLAASSRDVVAVDNRVEANGDDGVRVDMSAGRIERNVVTGNRGAAVRFGAPDGLLSVVDNVLGGNLGGAIAGSLPEAGLGPNAIGFPDGYPDVAAAVAAALERGEVADADRVCIETLRTASGNRQVASARTAMAIAPDLLRWLDLVWRQATGAGLRARPWVRDPGRGVTTRSLGGTHLEKRLTQIGL